MLMQLPESFTKVTPLSKGIAMVLFALLPFIGFFLGVKYQQLITQQTPEATIPIEKLPNPSPTSNLNTGWQTYTNTKYGFELQHPSDSNIEERDNGQSLYIRIQNYNDKNYDYQGLMAGQYYLEISIFDYQLGRKDPQTCTEELNNDRSVDLGAGVKGFRGLGLGGGDSMPYIFALCANRTNFDIYLQASEPQETVASKIVDSFIFIR